MKQLKYNTPDNDLIWQAITEASDYPPGDPRRSWNTPLTPDEKANLGGAGPDIGEFDKEKFKGQLEHALNSMTHHDLGVINITAPDGPAWNAAYQKIILGHDGYPSEQYNLLPMTWPGKEAVAHGLDGKVHPDFLSNQ